MSRLGGSARGRGARGVLGQASSPRPGPARPPSLPGSRVLCGGTCARCVGDAGGAGLGEACRLPDRGPHGGGGIARGPRRGLGPPERAAAGWGGSRAGPGGSRWGRRRWGGSGSSRRGPGCPGPGPGPGAGWARTRAQAPPAMPGSRGEICRASRALPGPTALVQVRALGLRRPPPPPAARPTGARRAGPHGAEGGDAARAAAGGAGGDGRRDSERARATGAQRGGADAMLATELARPQCAVSKAAAAARHQQHGNKAAAAAAAR
jgi:hypothetical protein